MKSWNEVAMDMFPTHELWLLRLNEKYSFLGYDFIYKNGCYYAISNDPAITKSFFAPFYYPPVGETKMEFISWLNRRLSAEGKPLEGGY